MNLSLEEKRMLKKLVKENLNNRNLNEKTLDKMANEFNAEFNRNHDEVKNELDKLIRIYLY